MVNEGKLIGILLIGAIGLGAVANLAVGPTAGRVTASTLLAVLAVFLLVLGVGYLRAYRQVDRSEERSPGAVGRGATDSTVVTVQGTARPLEETLSAPRTEDAVDSLVYHHIVREERTGTGEGSRVKKNVRKTVPFAVEGGSGSVAVDPSEATVLLETSVEHGSGDISGEVSRLDTGEEVFVTGELTQSYELDIPTDGQQYGVTGPSGSLPQLLERVVGAPFLVSDRSQTSLARRLRFRGVAALVGVVLVCGVLGIQTVELLP